MPVVVLAEMAGVERTFAIVKPDAVARKGNGSLRATPRRLPSSVPISEKPAVNTDTAFTPLAPQSRMNSGTAEAGMQQTT